MAEPSFMKVSGIIGPFTVLREILNNNQVMRSYLVKECELIRNKLLKEIKRPFFFFFFRLYKNRIYLSSPDLSLFTCTVGLTLLTPAKAEKQDRASQERQRTQGVDESSHQAKTRQG